MPSDWRADTEAALGVDVSEVEDIAVLFDPSTLSAGAAKAIGIDGFARLASGQSVAEPLAPEVCAELQIPRASWLSHHTCHALSGWMIEPEPVSLRVVVDGVGDGRSWSVYRDERLLAAGPIRNGSIGWGMRDAGKLLGVRYGHYNDIAGKLMGLQSYGLVDEGYADFLRRFDFARLRDIWSVKIGRAHV